MKQIEKDLIVNKVLSYMEQDLTYLKTDSKETDDWLLFVAYRIKAMILNASYRKAQMKHRYERKDLKEEYEDLQDFISFLYDANWIKIDYNAVDKGNYQTFYDNKKEIDMYLGDMSIVFFNLIEKFSFTTSESPEFKEVYKEISDKMLPLFIEALYIGLDKIDISKSGREKATYLNKVVLTQFIQLQMKRDGIVKVRQKENTFYIKPEIKDDEDSWKIILGRTFKEMGVESVRPSLTKKQYKLLNDVYDITKKKIELKDYDWFRWDKKGHPKLVKRNVAKHLGISESNYIQSMKRIEHKIDEVFVTIFDKYLKENY